MKFLQKIFELNTLENTKKIIDLDYTEFTDKNVKDGSNIIYDNEKSFIVNVTTIEAALYWSTIRTDKIKYKSLWINHIIKHGQFSSDYIELKNRIESKYEDVYVLTLPSKKETFFLRIQKNQSSEFDFPDMSLFNTYYGLDYEANSYVGIKNILLKNKIFKIIKSKIKQISNCEIILSNLKNRNSKIVSNGSQILYDINGEIFIKVTNYIAAKSWLIYQDLNGIPANNKVPYIESEIKFNNIVQYIYISKKFNDRFYIKSKSMEPGRFDNEDEKGEKRFEKKIEAKKYLDDIRGSNIKLISGESGEEDYGRLTSDIRKKIKDKNLLKLFPGMTKYKSEIGKITYKAKKETDEDVKNGTNVVYDDGKNKLVEVTNKYADGFWSYTYAPGNMSPLKINADMVLQGDKNFKFTKGAKVFVLIAPNLPKGFKRIKIFKGTNTGHIFYHIIGNFPLEIFKKLPDSYSRRDYIVKQLLTKLPLKTSEFLDEKKFIIDGFRGNKRKISLYKEHKFFENNKSISAFPINIKNNKPNQIKFLEYIYERQNIKRADWTFLKIGSAIVFLILKGQFAGRRLVFKEKGMDLVFYDERGKNITTYVKDKIVPVYPSLKLFLNRGLDKDTDIIDKNKMYEKVKNNLVYKEVLQNAIDISTKKNIKSGIFSFTSKELYSQYNNEHKNIKEIPKISISPISNVRRRNVEAINKKDYNAWFIPQQQEDSIGNMEIFYIDSLNWIKDNINWKSPILNKINIESSTSNKYDKNVKYST